MSRFSTVLCTFGCCSDIGAVCALGAFWLMKDGLPKDAKLFGCSNARASKLLFGFSCFAYSFAFFSASWRPVAITVMRQVSTSVSSYIAPKMMLASSPTICCT